MAKRDKLDLDITSSVRVLGDPFDPKKVLFQERVLVRVVDSVRQLLEPVAEMIGGACRAFLNSINGWTGRKAHCGL